MKQNTDLMRRLGYRTKSEVVGKEREERAQREAEQLKEKLHGMSVPDLQRKFLEHTFREQICTGIRRGNLSTSVPKKTIWLCVQEMRSIGFINQIKAELAERGISLDSYHPASGEIDSVIEEQKRLVEEGMRKAKSN
jgi:hypothetical protein